MEPLNLIPPAKTAAIVKKTAKLTPKPHSTYKKVNKLHLDHLNLISPAKTALQTPPWPSYPILTSKKQHLYAENDPQNLILPTKPAKLTPFGPSKPHPIYKTAIQKQPYKSSQTSSIWTLLTLSHL